MENHTAFLVWTKLELSVRCFGTNMKRLIIVTLLLIISLSNNAFALEVPPKPLGRVSDYTNTLSAGEIRELEQVLANYEQETTNQIAVVLMRSLEGDNLEDYSIRLAEQWKIGQIGKDNGVILLIFKQDRKIRIEVGYGLEAVLTDSLAGEIIRNNIAPYFRRGEFFGGIWNGVSAIISAIKGEYRVRSGADVPKIEEGPKPLSSPFPRWVIWMVLGSGVLIVLMFFGGIFLMNYWDWRAARVKNPGGLGLWAFLVQFFGLWIGGFLIYFARNFKVLIIGFIMFLAAILVSIFDYRKRPRDKSGAGGFGYWGGGSSGGSFSGGGGGFGGGGASGGW
jgi:uncharacterized protein